MRYLVTGGAGFIGSNFIRFLFNKYGEAASVVNLDKLTYAGIRENLAEYEGKPNYKFLQGDIASVEDVAEAYKGVDGSGVDVVVNFAAETHVDRSLQSAGEFIHTDVVGTFVLLEAARRAPALRRFVQISTDEVYGSVAEGASRETDELRPRNPYSASKAAADRLAYSYWASYGVPVIVTRASNNYGPNQFPEKVIPLFITNLIDGLKVPLYGDGLNVRDWLHVDDHCRALDLVIANGVNGEVYNIGGGNEVRNVDLTHRLIELLGCDAGMIQPVTDRPGHDRRYALDTAKVRALGWTPEVAFDAGLAGTVHWYQANEWWWRPIKEQDAAFRAYYDAQYGNR